MADSWPEIIPIEILTEIFKYLPRTDRMSCSLVSQKWKDALDRKDLWKKIILHIDKDFLEPSTILLTSEYYRHINSLEIGWEKPQIQNRWLPLKIHDLTKRVVRYMFILNENGVQIKSFKIFEWYDVYPLKKIIYHLARFLRIQTGLEKIVFYNTNLPKTECLRILDACLNSKQSVSSLEIHNYFYNYNTAFDTVEFLGYLQEFNYLKELKIDYFIFCGRRIIDVIAENGRVHLKNVEIFFDETDIHSHIIPDRKWRKLRRCCPNLKMSVTIKNICHYEQIEFIFLMRNMPLSAFSMHTGSKYNQTVSRNFEGTLTRLIKNHWKTLEFVNLQLKNNKESIDNLLLQIIQKCPKLKTLFFDGNVNQNMLLFYEIFKYRETAAGLIVKIMPTNLKYTTNLVHVFS
ncbi:hypothetical protein NQ315_004264 [Exocentrus adspersus]|uniref:F-box domain-containing protein n=1 Tax=Exocentrus adspersus TaxID=1586481 RepID=A0AAV8W6X3_9CUCU|nr:hypothetical protein NQ315_004264 [Exocentrus adspersus]